MGQCYRERGLLTKSRDAFYGALTTIVGATPTHYHCMTLSSHDSVKTPIDTVITHLLDSPLDFLSTPLSTPLNVTYPLNT